MTNRIESMQLNANELRKLRELRDERDTLQDGIISRDMTIEALRQRVKDLEVEIERLRGALITGASLLEQGCNTEDMAASMRRAAAETGKETK